jgi:hypothetical protein
MLISAVWTLWRGGSKARRATRRHVRSLWLERLESRELLSATLSINSVSAIEPTFGPTVSGTLNPGNQAVLYPFQGLAGERIDLHWLSGTGGSWYLEEPAAGAFVNVGAGGYENPVLAGGGFGQDSTMTLPGNGSYALALVGGQSAAQSYSFQVTDVSDNPVALAGIDIQQSGTLAPGGSTSYQFNAPAGRLITYDDLEAGNGLSGSLTAPDGSMVWPIYHNQTSGPLALPRSGTYTLTLNNNTSASLPYDYKVLDVQAGTPLALGSTVNGAFTAGYAENIYTFQGSQGQRLLLNGLGGSGVSAALYGPGGITQVFTDSFPGNSGNGVPVTLLSSGTYYLVLNDGSAATPSYSFTLLDLTAVQTINPATTTGAAESGSLSPGNAVAAYQFNGNAGTRLFVSWGAT